MLEKKEILDLTRVLDEHLVIYRSGSYQDPRFEVAPWSSIADQGFLVSHISLGTQTGTHIDAPAHFIEGAATLEELPVSKLIGSYYRVDLDSLFIKTKNVDCLEGYNSEPIIFLVSKQEEVLIDERALLRLCQLPSKLWVIAGNLCVSGRDPFYFNRFIAGQGIYLVEDIEHEAARQVKAGGEMIVLPLKLTGVSGAPCRVIAVQ